jgi:hypothetical protein
MEVVEQIKAISRALDAFSPQNHGDVETTAAPCRLPRHAGSDFVSFHDFSQGRYATFDCIACKQRYAVDDADVSIMSLGRGPRSMFALCASCTQPVT